MVYLLLAMKLNWKTSTAAIYLLAQLTLIIVARFSPNRYFVWAPHDIQTNYQLEVKDQHGDLTPGQLYKRYNMSNEGFIDLPSHHIIGWLKKYEELNPNSGTKHISFKYSINGKEWKEWTYKPGSSDD